MAFSDRHASDIITNTLRTRICLHTGDDLLILHEGKIATEFGVSRTPIRQVLQILAYDLLVQTRPGIGTIAMPLDEGMFERDLKTAQSMLSACAKVSAHPVPQETKFSLIALSAMTEDAAQNDGGRSSFMDISTRLLDTLTPIITDPLVENAYRASFFRIIRWRLRMFERDPEFTWERMTALVAVAAKAANDPEPGAIFAAMAERAQSPKFAHGLRRGDTNNARPSNVQNIR